MTINEIIEENRKLQLQYSKAVNTISILERKIEKLQREIERLQKENISLKDENMKLKKQNNILIRAMEIAVAIKDYNSLTKHLNLVLERIRNW